MNAFPTNHLCKLQVVFLLGGAHEKIMQNAVNRNLLGFCGL